MHSEAPSPAARDFPERVRLSGELLPRERIELPQGGGVPATQRPSGELWVKTPSGWR